MAENHPVGFQWVIEARERGATVIHVDPRFTRTSAMADIWVPLRAGSDIVFLGGLINYVLANGRDFRDYVVPYTNAATILREDFRDTEDLGGLFSGWDAESEVRPRPGCTRSRAAGRSGHVGRRRSRQDRGGEARTRPSAIDHAQHPRCVFQVLKRHFARYTPEMVEAGLRHAAGVVPADRGGVHCRASGPEKTGAICYAVGWTQHSTGVQIIRAAAILQLLLGNIGRPGGGILALRGHASIQGSTDIPTLYDILPGYLPMPKFGDGRADRSTRYIEKHKRADRRGGTTSTSTSSAC